MTRLMAFNQLRWLRDEFVAGQFALSEIIHQIETNRHWWAARRGGSGGVGGIGEGALRRCAQNFETTFIVRLFSEFEGILRAFWTSKVRPTNPGMATLIQRVAALRGMASDDLGRADEVRVFRNELVHQSISSEKRTFAECAGAIGKYISWLPNSW